MLYKRGNNIVEHCIIKNILFKSTIQSNKPLYKRNAGIDQYQQANFRSKASRPTSMIKGKFSVQSSDGLMGDTRKFETIQY